MKGVIIALLVVIGFSGYSQVTAGKIVFERRTNLLKRFTDERMKEWLKGKKVKIDMFELYFNDTISVFKPQESDLKEEMDWTTVKNTVVQNYKSNERLSVLGVWGDNIYIKDTLVERQWKVTASIRNIAGYDCRRMIWEKNDSTRIHAWFTTELISPTGPESFNGLPGTILGLATEDGGVVYFAKSVEVGAQDILSQLPEAPKKGALSEVETKTMLAEKFGGKPWAERMLESLFEW